MNKNGEMWFDDQGNAIQAHGGMILEYQGIWYWYGENKGADNCPGTSRVDVIGVSCYSSKNEMASGSEMCKKCRDEKSKHGRKSREGIH